MEMSKIQENIIKFSQRLLNLEIQKKELAEDIKALKTEFKEEGVPVQVVARILRELKREKKKNEFELGEEEQIKEWLSKDTTIDNGISSLAG